ncbi:MAG: helix-turn-helix domain-containing protein [Sporocytophaga sp.]|uniref:helix-turn-helix domain-containing protein n=1 Tax=Sporocytophaga sp. TaxID=2231183 RepID=UPI001B0D1A8F|nr:helix-turn-helix domain-containing protein [Sporocytophaga sp.]MBO9701847.1 helix-turn-helix domain-containing protein [Sporocytophaga sp.]
MYILITGCYSFCILNLLIFTLILWGRKKNSWSNIVFGLYLVLFGITMTFNLAVYTGALKLHYYYLCFFPAFMVGPSVYLFSRLQVGWTSFVKRTIILHFLLAFVFSIILSVCTFMISSLSLDSSCWFSGSGMPDLFRNIVVWHACFYHYYSWSYIRKLFKNNHQFIESEKNKITWIYDFLTTMLIFCALFMVLHTIRYLLVGSSPVGSSVISPITLLISYLFILKKCVGFTPIFSNKVVMETYHQVTTVSTKKRQSFTSEEIRTIGGKLIQVIDKEKVYRDQELSLSLLSEHVGINPKELSQFINQQYDVNFSDFINKYRVEESMRIMQDPSSQNLKLEAIAEIAGFSSRASFFSIFKKVTGHTPASFRKNLDV